MSDKDIISTDHPFSKSQRGIISAILDTLLPASEDGLMPSAGEFDLIEYLTEAAPDFVSHLPNIVDQFDADFATKSYPARHDLMEKFRSSEPQLFEQLLFHTCR